MGYPNHQDEMTEFLGAVFLLGIVAVLCIVAILFGLKITFYCILGLIVIGVIAHYVIFGRGILSSKK